VHFWLADAGGNVLLRRRPLAGLLGGMTELPLMPKRALADAILNRAQELLRVRQSDQTSKLVRGRR